jgi:hypothetical protein
LEKIVLLLGHWIWGLGHSWTEFRPSPQCACFQELVRIVLKGFGWGDGGGGGWIPGRLVFCWWPREALGWPARCLNRATSEFWSDQVVSLNPPTCSTVEPTREKWADSLQLSRTRSKRQTKMFAKEMQPLQDVRARANQVLFCSLSGQAILL